MESLSFEPELQKGVSDQPPESPIQEIIKAILKNQLSEEAKTGFYESCRVLKVVLQNIYKNPQEEKYRSVKLLNPKFSSNIAKYPSGLLILELLGFQQVPDTDPIMIYSYDTVEPLKEVINTIERIIGRPESDYQEIPKFQPLERKPSKAQLKSNEMEKQLKEYRSKQKNKLPGQVRNIQVPENLRSNQSNRTVANPVPYQHRQNIPENIASDLRMHQVYNTIGSFRDPRNLMLRAHELSNEFRVSQGKLALLWNEGLCVIACEHSKDMGDGKVPFGHQGFNKRYQRFPIFNVRGGAENVAYNNSISDPSKVSVDGWIESPGHRKNLLGRYHYMAIGVYINAQGMIYFTQLFAAI